jgi:ligand-binding sensor domain-containing protein
MALDATRATHQLAFSEWSTTSGLPQNSVQAIAQTADGYLWVGTAEGLARFDGVRFQSFTRETVPEMANDVISALDQRTRFRSRGREK